MNEYPVISFSNSFEIHISSRGSRSYQLKNKKQSLLKAIGNILKFTGKFLIQLGHCMLNQKNILIF